MPSLHDWHPTPSHFLPLEEKGYHYYRIRVRGCPILTKTLGNSFLIRKKICIFLSNRKFIFSLRDQTVSSIISIGKNCWVFIRTEIFFFFFASSTLFIYFRFLRQHWMSLYDLATWANGSEGKRTQKCWFYQNPKIDQLALEVDQSSGSTNMVKADLIHPLLS